MEQPKPRRRKGWFWTGVGLLIGSGILWTIFIRIAGASKGGVHFLWIPLFAILTAIAVYCVRRGMTPKVSEE